MVEKRASQLQLLSENIDLPVLKSWFSFLEILVLHLIWCSQNDIFYFEICLWTINISDWFLNPIKSISIYLSIYLSMYLSIYLYIYIYDMFVFKEHGLWQTWYSCLCWHAFSCAQVMFKLCMFVIFCPDLRASSRASWMAWCACSPCFPVQWSLGAPSHAIEGWPCLQVQKPRCHFWLWRIHWRWLPLSHGRCSRSNRWCSVPWSSMDGIASPRLQKLHGWHDEIATIAAEAFGWRHRLNPFLDP